LIIRLAGAFQPYPRQDIPMPPRYPPDLAITRADILRRIIGVGTLRRTGVLERKRRILNSRKRRIGSIGEIIFVVIVASLLMPGHSPYPDIKGLRPQPESIMNVQIPRNILIGIMLPDP